MLLKCVLRFELEETGTIDLLRSDMKKSAFGWLTNHCSNLYIHKATPNDQLVSELEN